MYKNLNVEALCANRPDIPAKGTEMGDYFRNNIRNYYACMTGVDEECQSDNQRIETFRVYLKILL